MASEQLVCLDNCPALKDNHPHDPGNSQLIEISGVTQSSQCLLPTEHTGAPQSQSAPVTEQDITVGHGGVKDTPAEGHVGGTGQVIEGEDLDAQVTGEGADTEGMGNGRNSSGHMIEGGPGETTRLKQEERDTWVQGTSEDVLVRDGESGLPEQLINIQVSDPERPGVPEPLIQPHTQDHRAEKSVNIPQVIGEEGPGVPELLIQVHTEGPEEESVHTLQVIGEEGPGVPELLIQVYTEGPEAEEKVHTSQVIGEEGPGVPELLIQVHTEGPEAEEEVHTSQVIGEEWPGVPESLIQVHTEGPEAEEEVHTSQVIGEEGPKLPELLIQVYTEGPGEEESVHTSQVIGEEGPGVPELITQVHTEGPEADEEVHTSQVIRKEGPELIIQVDTEGPEEEESVHTSQVIGEEGTGTAEVGTDGKASDSSEEAEKEVTPNPCAGPCWEGTLDTECSAARWERECTGREVKTDPTGQGDTQTGTVTERRQCHSAAAMKEREIQTEGDAHIFETPIEREIRLAMEREQMLRQERGISGSVGQPELVEVRRKMIVGEQLAGVGKERQLAGAQMLRDIQQETRREQDLVDQGKVMGAYDRGQQQEVQEKKMLFESMVTVSSDSPIKKRQSESQDYLEPEFAEFVVLGTSPEASILEVKKGPSFAEANGSNVIIIEHSSLLRRPASISPLDSPPVVPTPPSSFRGVSPVPAVGSPYFMLNSPSPRSLLEREIEEVQQREKELRRQRSSIYGKEALEITIKEQENREDIESGIYQPERPNWRKLEVNWPPNREESMNDVASEEVKESPRLSRQRSLLIQNWESGNPTPRDEQ